MSTTTFPGSPRGADLGLRPVHRWASAGPTERGLAAAAVGFVSLLVGGMLALAIDGVDGAPGGDGTNAEIAEFFADHRVAHLVNMHLASVAILVLLPLFAILLSRVLARAERTGEDHVAASVVLGAGLVAVLPAFVQAAAWSAAAYDVAGDSPEVARGLYDLGNLGFVLMAYPLAMLMVAAAFGAWQSGILSSRARTVTIVLAMLVALTAVPDGAVALGFGVFVLWSLAVSWSLLGRSATVV